MKIRGYRYAFGNPYRSELLRALRTCADTVSDLIVTLLSCAPCGWIPRTLIRRNNAILEARMSLLRVGRATANFIANLNGTNGGTLV